MSNSGNLFDRVGGVESKVDDVSAKMDSLSAKIDGLLSVKQTATTPKQTENPQVVLKRFISKAKKEYCWLGSESDFQNESIRLKVDWFLSLIIYYKTPFVKKRLLDPFGHNAENISEYKKTGGYTDVTPKTVFYS